jgi:hypothetical protein
MCPCVCVVLFVCVSACCSPEYTALKEERSAVLWAGLEKIIPDIRQRAEVGGCVWQGAVAGLFVWREDCCLLGCSPAWGVLTRL